MHNHLWRLLLETFLTNCSGNVDCEANIDGFDALLSIWTCLEAVKNIAWNGIITIQKCVDIWALEVLQG